MTSRLILTLVLLPTLVLGTVFVAPTTAIAACSYHGFINSNGQCTNSFYIRPFSYPLYNYNTYSIEQYIAYLQQLIDLLQKELDDEPYFQSNVEVETRSAVSLDDDNAELRGRIDLNDEDSAQVYFEYGKSRTNLNENSRIITIDESDDDDFKIMISGLDSDTLYYFRAIAKDENGDKDYGVVLSFRTDEDQSADEPSLETRSIINITNDGAELRGSVNMNDFNNGHVFFVYGEDDEQVKDIADDYDNYVDIDEDGDNLQKVLIDSDLDDSATYIREISGLDHDTRIYYNICVEYENADNDQIIACGDTKSFMTDN